MRDLSNKERRNVKFLIFQIIAANKDPVTREKLAEHMGEVYELLDDTDELPPVGLNKKGRPKTRTHQCIDSALKAGPIGEHNLKRGKTESQKYILTDSGIAALVRPSVSKLGVESKFRKSCSHAVWEALGNFDNLVEMSEEDFELEGSFL